jgi:hypothetical protein
VTVRLLVAQKQIAQQAFLAYFGYHDSRHLSKRQPFCTPSLCNLFLHFIINPVQVIASIILVYKMSVLPFIRTISYIPHRRRNTITNSARISISSFDLSQAQTMQVVLLNTAMSSRWLCFCTAAQYPTLVIFTVH